MDMLARFDAHSAKIDPHKTQTKGHSNRKYITREQARLTRKIQSKSRHINFHRAKLGMTH